MSSSPNHPITQLPSFACLDRRKLLGRSAAGLAAPAALGIAGFPNADLGAAATGSLTRTNRHELLAQAENSGLSEARLERLREVMTRDVENGAAPGLVYAVSRRGDAHVEAIGTMAFESNAPMRRDAIFRIASVSKPIVAAAAMILVEECVLRLDEPVDAFLPELADRQVLSSLDSPLDDTVPANRPITLRDLLTFRLGYGIIFAPPGTYPIQEAIEESGVFTDAAAGGILPTLPPDEIMAGYGRLPLLHQPGEQYFYNSGSDILGVLIARASDMSFGEFLQERLFAPLGMKDSGFYVPADKLDRLPTAYWLDVETGEDAVFDSADSSSFASPPPFEAGGSGLVSTVDDLLAFGEMMLNDGKYGDVRILSRPSVEVMTTDQLTPEQKAASPFFPGSWENRGWGFGVAIVTRRDTLSDTPGRYGWDGGWGTSWYVDPTEQLIGILLTQRLWDGINEVALYSDFWTSAYQAIDD
jgi:CubicO group peptidase (beta-lactamase class C family)